MITKFLQYLTKLEELTLHNNFGLFLEEKVFDTLSSLRYLDLSNTAIRLQEPHHQTLFSNMVSLHRTLFLI